MVQTPINPIAVQALSLDEFLQLPETKPASEYIDGQILQKLNVMRCYCDRLTFNHRNATDPV